MIKSFTATLAGVRFRFNVINALKLEVFQVYVNHNGKQVRFHMQDWNKGRFEITDREHCPAEYLDFENQLSDLILNSQSTIESSTEVV